MAGGLIQIQVEVFLHALGNLKVTRLYHLTLWSNLLTLHTLSELSTQVIITVVSSTLARGTAKHISHLNLYTMKFN